MSIAISVRRLFFLRVCRAGLAVLSFVMSLASPHAASAPLWAIPLTRLAAHDAEHGDQFGVSVSVHQRTVIVGAYWDDDAGSASGGAYLFEPTIEGAWIEKQKLVAYDAAANDWFGVSVAIHDDLALVGAALQDGAGTNAGAAYLFQRDPQNADHWVLLQKLTASDPHTDDWFGWRVALNDQIIAIGSHQNDQSGPDTGAIYVFRRSVEDTNHWEQFNKLTVPTLSPGAWLGFSLGLHGNQVIAGAPFDQPRGVSSGAAYLFNLDPIDSNQWETIQLLPETPSYNQQFGWSVAVHQQLAAVGARLTSRAAPQGGAVYLFHPDPGSAQWSQFDILVSNDNSTNDWFGESVALATGVLSVGVRLDDDQGNASGSAYLFQPNAQGVWRQTQKILAADGAKEFRFGESIALTEDLLLVGSFADDAPGFGFASGAAYLLGLSTFNPHLSIERVVEGLRISWTPAISAQVETSTNLTDWTPLQTGQPPLVISNAGPRQFFRLRQP